MSDSILVYSPAYNTDLTKYGVDKPFALDRGQCVLQALERDDFLPVKYVEPDPVSIDDLVLVHTPAYLDSLHDPAVWMEIFELKPEEYKPETAIYPLNMLLDDIRLKCGGTLKACEIALQTGFGANLGGGYHHAFPDQGRGFCVLNDIAVAARSLRKRKQVNKILILDLDFHQGDGTALIFAGDSNTFTVSVHSEEGWPEEKQISTLDVPIRSDQTNLYQEKVEQAVGQALSNFDPELVIYVAGSDPYELDVLPGTKFMQLTLPELKARDEFVIDTFADRNIPLSMVFAGGYGPHVWEVHYLAVRHLVARFRLRKETERIYTGRKT